MSKGTNNTGTLFFHIVSRTIEAFVPVIPHVYCFCREEILTVFLPVGAPQLSPWHHIEVFSFRVILW
jgi:hypothetical protein